MAFAAITVSSSGYQPSSGRSWYRNLASTWCTGLWCYQKIEYRCCIPESWQLKSYPIISEQNDQARFKGKIQKAWKAFDPDQSWYEIFRFTQNRTYSDTFDFDTFCTFRIPLEWFIGKGSKIILIWEIPNQKSVFGAFANPNTAPVETTSFSKDAVLEYHQVQSLVKRGTFQ